MKGCAIWLGLVASLVLGKANAKDYWQQRVEYTLDVKLDDVHHVLHATEHLAYFNNSPDTLRFIYFHLWPNAYKNNHTPFAKQRLLEGKEDFQNAKKNERGWLDSIDFIASGKGKLTIEYMDKSHEIAKVMLDKPLLPGQQADFDINFRVQIPKIFSRMGHEGQSYQISQWYPKPAVYDAAGWHTFPYLDQGEFYGEFGRYDVTITLPENYVVAATGRLLTAKEDTFLDSMARLTRKKIMDNTIKRKVVEIASSSKTKTIHYIQDNVHDFAWFADKRFYVMKGGVTLPRSGRQVASYTMFQPNLVDDWLRSTDYVDSTILFYSKYVGEYPYTSATAVSGALLPSAGGMEYPMVTVIGKVPAKQLERVIVHEVGHNWFYGMLGSNERQYPWMDEGINSFYEQLYFDKKEDNAEGKKTTLKEAFRGNMDRYLLSDQPLDLIHVYEARMRIDQPCNLPAADYTAMNYGTCVYGKTSWNLKYLYYYLGEYAFSKAMQSYFDKWHFKHPQPNDFKEVVQQESNQRMDWFFNDLMQTTKQMDYAIKKVRKDGGHDVLTIENKGQITAPVFIGGGHTVGNDIFQDATALPTQSRAPVKDKDTVSLAKVVYDTSKVFNVSFPTGDYDFYFINPYPLTPDLYGKNNKYYINPPKGRGKALQFKLALRPESFNHYTIHYMPVIGLNSQDGFMLGISVYSGLLPMRKLEYNFTPMFGFKSGGLDGFAMMGYNVYPYSASFTHHIAVRVSARQFTYNYAAKLAYRRIVPTLEYELNKSRKTNPMLHKIQLSSNLINHFSSGKTTGLSEMHLQERKALIGQYYVNQLRYSFVKEDVVHLCKGSFTVQQSDKFNRAMAELNFKNPSLLPRQLVWLRLFAGSYFGKLPTENRFMMPLGGNTGKLDPTYEHLYTDRQGNDQIALDGGGLKFGSDTFLSRRWMASVNVAASIVRLKSIPISLYFDLGAYMGDANKITTGYAGGIMIGEPQGIFALFIPVLYSSNISQWQKDTKQPYHLTFVLNLDKLSPYAVKREILKHLN